MAAPFILTPLILAPIVLVAAPAPHPAHLAGVYDGGQMEVAAALELGKDGRFRYMFSYGALDEAAAGSWATQAGTVVLSVEQFESNDPDAEGGFGNGVLIIDDRDLLLPRHDLQLRFRKR